jgi:DNA-directed RNA polymerase subunit RPC12/RpoP
MQTRRFTTNDAGFVCANCGLEVAPLGNTSRNHCPSCLCSLHVDVYPGDRACACHGLMRPVGVETEGRRGYVLVHRCERCGEVRRNRAVPEAAVQPDDFGRLIELSLGGAPSGDSGRRSR